MKKILKIFSFLLIFSLSLVFIGCNDQPDIPDDGETETVDYASSVKLDLTSSSLKAEATVKTFIDGDTTHFNVPKSVSETGVLKARYLAINTPESTGRIEEWGKKASLFTRSKLESAVSIYIESDNATWNLDSTGGRHLVWVWYKASNDSEYRNLNIEILQEGLAIASNSSDNKYGSVCTSAIAQAKKLKLNVHSGQKDPDFYYGDRVDLTLKELRTNIDEYANIKVAFEAVVTKVVGSTIYVEEYDPETDLYFGMQVYLGYGLPGKALEILSEGNRVLIVGTAQYYEAGGTWQISGLSYDPMDLKDPSNVKLISKGNECPYTLLDPVRFNTGSEKIVVEKDGEEVEKTFLCRQLMMNTTVTAVDLYVKKVYTTTNEASSSKGAMTLTCEVDGQTISVRTEVLYNNGSLVTEDDVLGKTITVQGIIDYYDGTYQIRVFKYSDITFQ